MEFITTRRAFEQKDLRVRYYIDLVACIVAMPGDRYTLYLSNGDAVQVDGCFELQIV